MASLPQLTVIGVGDATTCGTTDITWFYEGVDSPLFLTVTNIGVSQDNPISTSTRHFTPIGASTPVVNARADPTGIRQVSTPTSVVIATDISSDGSQFLWQPVAVQSGWYIVRASVPEQDLTLDSSPFFVKDSTDTSCLSVSSPPSTTLPPPSSTGSMTPTNTVVQTTQVPTPNPSGTPVPVAAATSSGLSKGAIAGIALGAIILALGWVAAWWFFFRKGKRSTRSQGTGGVKHLGHGRSALASMDSTSGLMGKPARSPFASRRPSTGTIGGPLSPSYDTAGLEKGSINSPYHPGFADGLRMPDHTQVPPSQGGRKYSGSSFDLPPLDYAQTSRRPSQTDSAYGRQSSDFATYPPTLPQFSEQYHASVVPLTRSPSLSTSATHQTSAFNQSVSPLSGVPYQMSPPSSAAPSPSPYSMREPSSPDSPSSPSDSTNVTGRARRQSVSNKKRKPVPVYDPGSEELTPTPFSPSPLPASSSPSPIPPSPTPPLGPSQTPHYTTRNRSQPELTHKSSFGPGGLEGKQLHYLIPDMPPPSKG